MGVIDQALTGDCARNGPGYYTYQTCSDSVSSPSLARRTSACSHCSVMDAKSARKRQELSILTSCSESIFVLASQMSIGKKPIELLPSPASDKGHILRCEWPQFQLSFKSVLLPMAELFQKFGVSRVGKFWSEPSPVFEVDFDSQASIQQIIDCLESGQLHRGMESIILPLTQMAWKDANPEVHPPEWKVDIDLELLQVLPNAQSKDAIIHQVNSTNVRACVRLWNERKVFDMGALLRWYRSKPRGLMEGKDCTIDTAYHRRHGITAVYCT